MREPCFVRLAIRVCFGSGVLLRCSLPFVLPSMCFVFWLILVVGVAASPRMQPLVLAALVRGSTSHVCAMRCGEQLPVCRCQWFPSLMWALPAMLWWAVACLYGGFSRCPVGGLLLPVCLYVILWVVIWDVLCLLWLRRPPIVLIRCAVYRDVG